MSLGWTINYKELPDMELTLPLSIVVIMLNFIIVGLGRITEDSYYKFSDYEGIPGYILLIFRIGLWVWFAYNAYRLHENAKGPFIGFTMNFLLIGTIWFVALPVILFASWMFVEWERNKVVIFGSLLIQTIAFVLFNYIFSQKSSFYKISTIGESVLPGKIH